MPLRVTAFLDLPHDVRSTSACAMRDKERSMTGRILVTGHTGFVGKALCLRLQAEGYEVLGLSASSGYDLAETSALEKVPHQGVRHVYHLAGRTFVPDSWEFPGDFYRTNTLGTQTVLDYCRKHSLPLTFVSTYLYGHPQYLPINEEHPLSPTNPYAHSKFLAEELCRFYAEQFGVRVTIVRPFNIYGPGQPAQFLIPTLIRQALHADAIEVQDAAPRRDFLFLDDMLEALLCFLRCEALHGVYNLGFGRSYSIAELVALLQRFSGKVKPLHDLGNQRKGEIPDVVADIGRMKSNFGWEPAFSLERGLEHILKGTRTTS